MTGLCSSNVPRYLLDFAFYHYLCITAGGQVVPEGTCRVVILYDQTMLFEYPSVLSRFCFLPLPMYHCWWTSWPRGYLSGSNFIWPDYALRISLGTFSILLFTTTHVPLLVDKLSPRVLVGLYFIWPDYALRISIGIFSILLFNNTHVPLLVDKLSPRVLVG